MRKTIHCLFAWLICLSIPAVLMGCAPSAESEDIAGLRVSDEYVGVVLERPEGKGIDELFDMPSSFSEDDPSSSRAVSVSFIGGSSTVVRYAETADGGWVAWTDDFCLYTPTNLSSDQMQMKVSVLASDQVETFDLSQQDVLSEYGIELGDAWG